MTFSPPSKEELDYTRDQMLAHLRMTAAAEIQGALLRILTQGDIIALSALGIDGRVEMLDVFIEYCKTLKQEIEK